jgi:hypothetical protein
MSLPSPLGLLKEIGKVMGEIFFALVTLVIVSAKVQWALLMLGIVLCLYHHWLLAVLSFAIGLGAAWIARNLRI